jgi:hypothetical protein
MRTISIPVYNRPQYLRQCLDSIKAAEHDVDWVLVISAEPGVGPESDQVFNMIHEIDWIETKISFNSFKRGIDVNTFLAADLAHQLGSTFNLYLEDDVVVGRDALIMAEWFSSSPFAVEPSIMCLRRKVEDLSKPSTLAEQNEGPLAEGLGYDTKWWPKHFRGYWLGYDRRMVGFGWDWSLSWKLNEFKFKQYRPFVNRARNIGMIGTHTPPNWFDPERCSPEYAGKEVVFNIEE